MKGTSRSSRRIGGEESLREHETLVELVEKSVEGRVMGNMKDTSRTSRKIG